jgi:hypothetical protein
MTLPLPHNAAPIMQARMKGLRPAGMVVVSLCGPVPTQQPLVMAEPRAAYDWRWVRGLDVCVYVRDQDAWALTLKAIALADPSCLNVWNPHGKWGAHVYLVPTAEDVDKPVSMWICELAFLEWMDFQNNDFLTGRTYARGPGGVPYAVDP